METQTPLKMFSTFVILCVLYNGVNGSASQEIDVMLKALNKPALKTIKSEDGDIIDCVDIYKQPAFDHPALKNHKIQMKPSLDFVSKKSKRPINGSYIPIRSQIWSKSGTCPVGTIPIRRVSREEISRASSPSQFGRKTPRVYNFLDKAHQHKANNTNSTTENLPRPTKHSEAALLAVGYNYIGVQSDINVWNAPRVQHGEYSTGQIWMLTGQTSIFETIEAGWMVNPSVFGDNHARLFTYWTIDGYDKTGCINLLCSGFVQTGIHLALGAAINPISSTTSEQYVLTIGMFLDPSSGNWWLLSEDIVLGYWPGTLLKSLRHSGTAVQWGGAVYSPNVRKKPHTKASMGSGDWAIQLFGKACFHTNIRIKDYSLQTKYPTLLSEFVDEYKCYSTILYREKDQLEPHFYFGGPGQNPECP